MNDDTPYTEELMDLLNAKADRIQDLKICHEMIKSYQNNLRLEVRRKKQLKHTIKQIRDRISELYDDQG